MAAKNRTAHDTLSERGAPLLLDINHAAAGRSEALVGYRRAYSLFLPISITVTWYGHRTNSSESAYASKPHPTSQIQGRTSPDFHNHTTPTHYQIPPQPLAASTSTPSPDS